MYDQFVQYLFEARCGVSDLADHGPLNGGHFDVGVVGQRLLVPIGSASRLLVAWLIEVRLRNQNQGLDGDKNLQQESQLRPISLVGAIKKAYKIHPFLILDFENKFLFLLAW